MRKQHMYDPQTIDQGDPAKVSSDKRRNRKFRTHLEAGPFRCILCHVLDVTEKQILCVKHYGKIFAYCKYCFDVQTIDKKHLLIEDTAAYFRKRETAGLHIRPLFE